MVKVVRARALRSRDFNCDGKIDVATIVTDGSGNYYISAVLSNGDGTFKTAVLTAVPGNDSNAQIVVGDVNGDKKDDVIVAHLKTATTVLAPPPALTCS